MSDVWLTEDLPFLHAVREAEDAAPAGRPVQVSRNTALFGEDLDMALKIAVRLNRADFIDFEPVEVMSGMIDGFVSGLTERGRRAIGQWPSDDPWAGLVELLSRQIANESDPSKKGRLEGLRDAVLAAGRDISASLLKAYLQQQLGI